MGTSENIKQLHTKGFAGLSCLTSEVNLFYETSSEKMFNAPLHISDVEDGSVTTNKSTASFSMFEFLSSHKKLIIAAIVVVFVVWLANQTSNPTSKSPVAQRPKTVSPSPSTPRATHNRPTETQMPSISQNVSHNADIKYDMPPVGTSQSLTVSQIRWVLRESIRIDAMRDVVTTNDAINKFNNIVNNYNMRGVKFRYYKRDMQHAQRDIEAVRSKIVSEAISEAQSWNTSRQISSMPNSQGKRSNSNASHEFPAIKLEGSGNDQRTLTEAEIKEVQQLLQSFGYTPGPIDGKVGKLTIDAIKMFQKDMKLVQSGKLNQDLLKLLKRKY
jgi:hypothetical protein